jgi:hypothetical protein
MLVRHRTPSHQSLQRSSLTKIADLEERESGATESGDRDRPKRAEAPAVAAKHQWLIANGELPSAEFQLFSRTRGCFGSLLFFVRASVGRKQELFQVSFEFQTVIFTEVGEFKGLQTALGGPHGKKHSDLAAYRAAAYVKHHFCLDAFIERSVEVEQSSGEGKLMQSGPYLSSALQPDQSQNGSGQFDPRGAPLVICLFGMRHTSLPTMTLPV